MQRGESRKINKCADRFASNILLGDTVSFCTLGFWSIVGFFTTADRWLLLVSGALDSSYVLGQHVDHLVNKHVVRFRVTKGLWNQ